MQRALIVVVCLFIANVASAQQKREDQCKFALSDLEAKRTHGFQSIAPVPPRITTLPNGFSMTLEYKVVTLQDPALTSKDPALNRSGVCFFEKAQLISARVAPLPVAESASNDDDYEKFLSDVERKHPKLNPDSPQFDAKLEQSVSAKMSQYKKQGMKPSDALGKALVDHGMK